MNNEKLSEHPIGRISSFLWLAIAVGCFHLAYTSIHFPAAGFSIFGYAYALVRLANQSTVRRSFYFGLAAGYLCVAPQLLFFWRIFNPEAISLWFVLAFWTGLFTAMVGASYRRWGQTRTMWLVPVIWTGVEYFRSELYYLKFSWLNIGYALPAPLNGFGRAHIGMYGIGFLVFGIMAVIANWRPVWGYLRERMPVKGIVILLSAAFIWVLFVPAPCSKQSCTSLSLAGIQTEGLLPNLLPKALDRVLAESPDAQILVLSEYTLNGSVPDSLQQWCRDHERYLVVGGTEQVTADDFYNTVFVVDPKGDIIFKQAKCVPIQFFLDGLPATGQAVWNSPWGKIGICICYDLSYTRVTDRLVRQGAQILIVPTMDATSWGRHEHELHSRVAPMRAAEYGVPIFRLASSGISQAVTHSGHVIAQTTFPGKLEIISAQLHLPPGGSLPVDRFLAPTCTGLALIILLVLVWLAWRNRQKTGS
jgi:apolipoprotein N-acyltransferase